MVFKRDSMESAPIFSVIFMEEAAAFLSSLPDKPRRKIYYNIDKSRYFIDRELFKKLENTDIWEFRTLYEGNCYRLFAFWDTNNEALVVATHGFHKKTQKTPAKEITKAERLKETYFNDKKQQTI